MTGKQTIFYIGFDKVVFLTKKSTLKIDLVNYPTKIPEIKTWYDRFKK